MIAAHNDVCSAIARFLGDCGVGVAQESHDFLPLGKLRMDLLVRHGGSKRVALAVDFTRRVGATRAQLSAAERDKVKKYTAHYAGVGLVEMYGFACDHRGCLGPMAQQVVEMLVAAAARACGADEDDLRAELRGAIGASLTEMLALQYARAAERCGDTGLGVPRLGALRPAGSRRPGVGAGTS